MQLNVMKILESYNKISNNVYTERLLRLMSTTGQVNHLAHLLVTISLEGKV